MSLLPEKVLLLGSAPYMPLWWELNGAAYLKENYCVAAINNAWHIPAPQLPDLWIRPSDYYRKSPAAMHPSKEQAGRMAQITETQYNKPGPVKVARVDGGTMLLNALQFVLNEFLAQPRERPLTLVIAGCDLQYPPGAGHFYEGGKADPLRKGPGWIAKDLARLAMEGVAWPNVSILNAGWSPHTILPFPKIPTCKPLVSICTPIHNRSALHAKQTAGLTDALGEPPWPAELVLADFKSTDTDWGYLKQLPVPVRRVLVDAPFSVGAGRNVAADHSKGAILFFLDTDMLLPPGLIAELAVLAAGGSVVCPLYELEISPGGARKWGCGWGNLVVLRRLTGKERFSEKITWGGEDTAYAMALKTRLPLWRERVAGFLHQWHPKEAPGQSWYGKQKALPAHLGGHQGTTHTDAGVLAWLKEKWSVRSMLDIGCGPGGMKEVADKLGIEWTGIDGDPAVVRPGTIHHDFTKGGVDGLQMFDLAWSVEFVEHVREEFLPHCMSAFKKARVVCLTHAPPGTRGHHHVNCRSSEYWIAAFERAGYSLNSEATENIRHASTMSRDFMRRNGLVFVRAGDTTVRHRVSAA